MVWGGPVDIDSLSTLLNRLHSFAFDPVPAGGVHKRGRKLFGPDP